MQNKTQAPSSSTIKSNKSSIVKGSIKIGTLNIRGGALDKK